MIPLIFAQEAGSVPPPAGGSGLTLLLIQVVMIVGIFWFVMLRPQQKERKRVEQTLMDMKRGDEVITVGGIIGDVVHVQLAPAAEGAEPTPRMDDRVTIKSGESKLVVERGRIARVSPKGA